MIDYEWLVFLAPASAIAGMAAIASGKGRKDCLSLRQEGIRTNRLVKQLMIDMQMHRGMLTAYLSGDKSFGPRIEKKQLEIDRDVAALDPLREQGMMKAQRWDKIKRDWLALRGEAVGLSLEENFRRHSALIREVLYLMGDVAERSQIAGVCAADPALVQTLWSHLPAVAEGLGQARGMGTGVAAKKYCSSVARIKLRFLEEHIRETMGRVNHDLAGAGCAQTLGAPVIGLWEASNQTVREFLSMLEGNLLNVERPTIAADQYFSMSTKALDAVFHVFDQASEAMERAMAGTAH